MNYLPDCKLIENPDWFQIKGRYTHWTFLLLPGSWFYSFPLLFDGKIIYWITFGLSSMLITFLIILASNFTIRIDRNNVIIKLTFLFIPIYRITSRINDLIINHSDAKDLTLISPRKDCFSKDVRDNLRFSYIMPFDSDEYYLSIDYKNKELDISIGCHQFIWNSLINGIKKLEEKTSAANQILQ